MLLTKAMALEKLKQYLSFAPGSVGTPEEQAEQLVYRQQVVDRIFGERIFVNDAEFEEALDRLESGDE
jgi:predicted Rossmann-fold nucleotide-binding protein